MKSIVMVGGGIQQIPAVQKLKKSGYVVIVSDKNPDAPAARMADFHIVASGSDVKKISTWILREKTKLNIKGIFTLIHLAYEVSVIANTCNLPSLPPEIILKSDDKLLNKEILKQNNLPTANYFIIESFEDFKNKLKEFNFSAILKTTDSFGGKGTQIIENEENLEEKWSQVSHIVSSGSIILEEKLNGEFIDVQGFMHDGKFYRGGISSSWFTVELPGVGPINPIETYHIAPAPQPKSIIDEAYTLFEKACRCSGLDWGPVGIDLILTETGLKIIEISARLHGPNGSLRIHPYSTGIEPILFLAQLISGESPNPEFLEHKFEKCSICWVYPGKPGLVKKIEIPTHPDIIDYNIYSTIGEPYNTKSPYSGSLGIFIQSDSLEKAKSVVNFLEKNLVYHVQ